MIQLKIAKGHIKSHLDIIIDLYNNYFYEQPVALLFKLNVIIKQLNQINVNINNELNAIITKYCKFDKNNMPAVRQNKELNQIEYELIDEAAREEFNTYFIGKQQEVVILSDIPFLTMDDIKESKYMTPEHVNILVNYIIVK